MIGAVLGKRFERLLFFTAPISLAAIVVCLVAIASSRQKERIEARCLRQLSDVVESNAGELAKKRKAAGRNEYRLLNYRLELQRKWIYGSDVLSDCYDPMAAELEKDQYKQEPQDLVQTLRDRAAALDKTPLSVYGITLPKDATLDLYVTKITIELELLTRVLQVVLLPVLLMWLGSLYATRYRESIAISKTSSLAEVFPHIINVYPAFDMPSVRKRSLLAPYVKPFACFVYTVTRLALLAAFVGPPVVAYLFSLYLGASQNLSLWHIAGGFLVGMFALVVMIAELLPTHARKVFASPIRGLEF